MLKNKIALLENEVDPYCIPITGEGKFFSWDIYLYHLLLKF